MNTVNPVPSIERAFKQAFTKAIDQIAVVLANTVLAIVVSILSAVTIIGILFLPAIWGGYIESMIQLLRGEKVGIGKFFSSGLNQFGIYLGATSLLILGVFLGYIFFVIPGIYLSVRWIFVMFIIADQKTNVFEAFVISGKLVVGQWWDIFALWLLVEIMGGVLGATGIGILIAVPYGILVTGQYYLDTVNEEPKED